MYDPEVSLGTGTRGEMGELSRGQEPSVKYTMVAGCATAGASIADKAAEEEGGNEPGTSLPSLA